MGQVPRRPAALAAATACWCLLLLAVEAARLPSHPELRSACVRLQSDGVRGCVAKTADGFQFSSQESPDCVASGVYVDSALTASNFGKLRVVTSAASPDADQMYAAGYLEGYLTAERIYDNHHNMLAYFTQQLNASLDKPLEWLDRQEAWAAQQVAQHAAPPGGPDPGQPDDPSLAFWRLLGLLDRQFDGLVDGYQARATLEKQQQGRKGAGEVSVGWLDRRDLKFINNNGELYDLIDYYEAGLGAGASPNVHNVDEDGRVMAMKLGTQGKCSALIKVTGDLSDLLIGHSTWDTFTAMLRIFKHYELNLADEAVVTRRLSFSSYPGELFSDDDLYLLESGLVVLETTNHIYTPESVYRPLTPESVLSWQRVRIANMAAANGSGWVRHFSYSNSGTYNNQYMVVDTNRFVPRTELQPGLLWVVEQLPATVVAADMTEVLARGYWPSYNVAFFPQIYEAAGYPEMINELVAKGEKKHAFSISWLKYQVSPRAMIFRRDQGRVSTLDDMKRIMRYNDWKKDPYALGNPLGAVCGRGDLATDASALAKGCYDSKVTSYGLARKLEAEVVSGPTTQGQPIFTWDDKRWQGLQHRGQPTAFNFTFERMAAKDLPLAAECRWAASAAMAASL